MHLHARVNILLQTMVMIYTAQQKLSTDVDIVPKALNEYETFYMMFCMFARKNVILLGVSGLKLHFDVLCM